MDCQSRFPSKGILRVNGKLPLNSSMLFEAQAKNDSTNGKVMRYYRNLQDITTAVDRIVG